MSNAQALTYLLRGIHLAKTPDAKEAWIRATWDAATEAAAKKCDDLADGNASSMAYVCAAAIRGK